MSKILWISDAGTSTGFGRVTEEIGSRLVSMGHEVHALAIGYKAKDPYEGLLKLHRAEAGPNGHALGFDRVVELLGLVAPDVVVTLEDIPMLTQRLTKNPWDRGMELLRGAPILSYLPIDGYNPPPSWKEILTRVYPVAMSHFGVEQLGIEMPVVYHGIDSDFFRPPTAEEKRDARDKFGLSQDAFIVGRVDTNSGRKDWGATWAVVEQLASMGVGVSMLCHTKGRNPGHGANLEELASKGKGTYILTGGEPMSNEDLRALYWTMDLYLTTSRGEGFGLTAAEAEACGLPVVATDCSATREVVGGNGTGGMLCKPARAFMANPYGLEHKLADIDEMADAIRYLISVPDYRRQLGAQGREHVVTTFSWDRAAESFHQLITGLVSGQSQEA